MQTFAAYAFEFLNGLVNLLPGPLRYRFVRFIGWVYSRYPHAQKKALETNLSQLLGLKGAELARATTETFKNFTVTLYDFFTPNGIKVEVPERAKLEELRKKHPGVMFLTFHMGHWELGARVMRQWGWPVTAVYQPYRNKKFKQVIESRRAPGVNFIPVGQRAATGVRDALKRGDVVAMLGDHPFGEDGSSVEILGHRVTWPKGPILLAVKQKAPIVVAVVVRTAPRRYEAIVSDPLIPKANSRQEVERLVQEVGHKFGMLLKQYPTQWYRLRPLDFIS
jgi:lauroyl/myristoyl acyltransferase